MSGHRLLSHSKPISSGEIVQQQMFWLGSSCFVSLNELLIERYNGQFAVIKASQLFGRYADNTGSREKDYYDLSSFVKHALNPLLSNFRANGWKIYKIRGHLTFVFFRKDDTVPDGILNTSAILDDLDDYLSDALENK